MPTTVRFLIIMSLLGGAIYAGLYVLAVYFEPDQREVTKTVYGVHVRQ